MKIPVMMSAIQIATDVIEKLQEENRVCLETLNKSQNHNKYLERQLAEKDKLIKILEDRLRVGTNSYLEISNRQKELTIKHLELQIQKLLKENQDLECEINAVKSDICSKCEEKLLYGVSRDSKVTSKSSVKRPIGKASASVTDKKAPQTECPNRQKMLERIIEHKDKRIMHLSKEVQRLSLIEKKLTDKIYRLTKLLPLSHMSSEMLTDCLLKEIQLLESQIQSYKDKYDKLHLADDMHKFAKCNQSHIQDSAMKNKSYPQSKSDLLGKGKKENINSSLHVLPKVEEIDVARKENETLLRNLHKLYNDVQELKHLIATENEKLSKGLNRNSAKNELLKMHWEEIMKRLNDISESIRGITHSDSKYKNDYTNESHFLDKDIVISKLQERLREALGMVTDYENENRGLREEVENLKEQLLQEERKHQSELKKLMDEKEYHGSNLLSNEVEKLKEVLNIKQTQLDAAENHIKTCKTLIEELQKSHKHLDSENIKLQTDTVASETEKFISDFNEQRYKLLEKKLEVSEKNIRTCEDVIEELQYNITRLKEKNMQLESELHIVKSQNVLAEANDHQNVSLKTKLSHSENQINSFKKMIRDLQNKVNSLEEENSKLNSKIAENKDVPFHSTEQEKSLQAKLDVSEKQICILQSTVEKLQNATKVLEGEKTDLQSELQQLKYKMSITSAYDDDVMTLKNKLILKEEENRNLKESLHTLESKTLEMNHYRKSLHREIENLCKTLMENNENESSSYRKAIYKGAILRSAQALLRLDDDYNLKSEDVEKCSALDEIKHQVEVYLTEVARIHELLTIKEQERDELLKEYLDFGDSSAFLGTSPPLKHESHIKGTAISDDLKSSATLLPLSSSESNASSSKPSSEHSDKRSIGVTTSSRTEKTVKFDSSDCEAELKRAQEELSTIKSVNSFLSSNCSKLDNMLALERTEHAKCERELEIYRGNVKELNSQLNVKNNMAKRLNALIEMMRSKECNDEITVEQLKSEIKCLIDENRKIFVRVTATESELSKCKQENAEVQNALDTMKRQLLNEKYEHAKVKNELKHLRKQLSDS